MSVSLTVLQPHRIDVGRGYPNDFVSLFEKPRSSTPFVRVDTPVRQLPSSVPVPDVEMSTPHRGLPPPAAMALPEPHRTPAPPVSHALGALPGPPHQWQGPEDAMRNWLAAKGEEDRRKQEEERTKQEGYRLEQRKIEQAMLREALQAGVPPAMVPMIYAGGSNLANMTHELLRHYAMELQAVTHQLQSVMAPPEVQAEQRFASHAPAAYAVSNAAENLQATPHQSVPPQPVEAAPATGPMQTVFAAYQVPGNRQTSAPRSTPQSQLPRLATSDMYVYQSPQQQGRILGAQPAQSTQPPPPQDHTRSSPQFQFHQWVPPSEGKSTLPQTPASKGEPHSARPGSQPSDGDVKDSPRKRKAGDPHQAAPTPSQGSPAFSSASMSSVRRMAHARSRSNTSTETYSRPESRRELEIIREVPPRSVASDAGPVTEEHRASSRHSATFP